MSGKKITLIASIGAALEYYDFIIYGLLAGYIGSNFFPAADNTTHLLESFGIFALGYLARPIGGILFGNQGDRKGRKPMFLLSIMLMGLATLSIGLLPTYRQIGMAATMILLLLRVIQGFAFGSEVPGIVTYLVEHVHASGRSMHTGFALSSLSISAALGMALIFILNESLTVTQMQTYGWRIPFVLGGVLGLLSYFIRHKLQETPVFLASLKNNQLSKGQPIFHLLRFYPSYIFLGTGITLLTACLTVFNISMPTYLKQFSHYTANDIYFYTLIGFLWAAIATPVTGWIADQLGRTRIFVSMISLLILIAIGFYSLPEWYAYFPLVVFIIIYQTFISSLSSAYLPMLAEVFPPSIRFTGTAFCYNLAYSIAAFTPAILINFFNNGATGMSHVALLLIGLCFVTLISALVFDKANQ